MADMPVWKGLLEWSLQHHDGTSGATAMSEENRKWLEAAMKDSVVDFGKLLVELKSSIEEGAARVQDGASAGSETIVEEIEASLDNLVEIVEHIDLARDLSSIGGLPMLFELLACDQPGLRSRAADVIGTCAQNNPPVQESFYNGGVLERLLPLLHDPAPSVRAKGLFAMSCQLRGHAPSLVWLRLHGGREALVDALRDEDPRIQRKALQVLSSWVRMFPRDRAGLIPVGVLPALLPLLDGRDAAAREAAFALAGELAEDDEALRAMLGDPAWRVTVQAASVRMDTVRREDWESVRDEAESVLALARALQREPAPPGAVPTSSVEPPEAAGRQLRVILTDATTVAGRSAPSG